LLAGAGDFADAQGAAFAGAAGADVDAGFAQGRGDLADLAADGADVVGQVAGGYPGVGADLADLVQQFGGGAFPRGGFAAAGAGAGGEPVDGVGEGVALD
jgi:hypothetical protein